VGPAVETSNQQVARDSVDSPASEQRPLPMSPFSVAMLAGGESRRMGTDKALIDVDLDGDTIGDRVLVASILAGASEAIAVGGNAERLRSQGWQYVADQWPKQGPLGGLITALERSSFPIVVVLACDHPDVDPHEISDMVVALESQPDIAAAVPTIEGQPHVLHSVWRTSVASLLRSAFERGERAPVALLRAIRWAPLRVNNLASIADVDTPQQLAERRSARG
jgi:molybdenum cofactor guanylyltransferase